MAVVVHVVDAHVSQPIDLAADSHPRVEQVVVSRRKVGAEGRAEILPRLNDRDGVVSGRIRRRVPTGDDAEGVGLAGPYQPGRLHDVLRRQVIDRAQRVACAVF